MRKTHTISEDELTEQIRISSKKEILAYLKDGVPRSQKITDVLDVWKQVNAELQIKQGMLNRFSRIISMMPATERSEHFRAMRQKLLP